MGPRETGAPFSCGVLLWCVVVVCCCGVALLSLWSRRDRGQGLCRPIPLHALPLPLFLLLLPLLFSFPLHSFSPFSFPPSSFLHPSPFTLHPSPLLLFSSFSLLFSSLLFSSLPSLSPLLLFPYLLRLCLSSSLFSSPTSVLSYPTLHLLFPSPHPLSCRRPHSNFRACKTGTPARRHPRRRRNPVIVQTPPLGYLVPSYVRQRGP